MTTTKTTTTTEEAPTRSECHELIDRVAAGFEVADQAALLQAICLELLEVREHQGNTVEILAAARIGYLPGFDHHLGEMVVKTGFTQARRSAEATS